MITEIKLLNYTHLLNKNGVYLKSYQSDHLIIKSNLDYFTIFYPKRKKIKSKAYIFNKSN